MKGNRDKTPSRQITSEFVSRLEKQEADPIHLLESILGRRVAINSILPSTMQKHNISYTKSVRFSLNADGPQSQGVANRGEEGGQNAMRSSKHTGGKSSTGKDSDRDGFGQDFMLLKLQQLIDNEHGREFDPANGLAESTDRKLLLKDGNCDFTYARIVDKKLLRSKTDIKIKVAENVISSIEELAKQKVKSLQDKRQGRRFSDQLQSSNTRIEAKKFILESYLDKRAFSDNESDSDKLFVVAKSKKKNDAKKTQQPLNRQGTGVSKIKATNSVSTTCGTNQRTVSKEKAIKNKVQPLNEKSKVDAAIPKPMLVHPLSKVYDEDKDSNDDHIKSNNTENDAKKQGSHENKDKRPSKHQANKDNIKSCLKKQSKYGIYDTVMRQTEFASSIIKPQPCLPADHIGTPNSAKHRHADNAVKLPTINESECELSPASHGMPDKDAFAHPIDHGDADVHAQKARDQSKCCTLI